MAQRLIVGVDRPYIHDLREEISEKQCLGADYFVAPLVDVCYGKGQHLARIGSSVESGRGMESRDWITNIIGKISEWIDLDSSNGAERQASLQALQEETAWASYLSLQAILLPTPRFNSVNYARALMQAFTGYQQFYIRIPMITHFHSQENVSNIHDRDGWLLWDGLRQHIGDAGRYFVALELCEECENIPTDSIGTAFISRWCAEPVKLLIIPTQLFQTNSAGYPVLTKRMQQMLGLLLPHCSQVMLTGESTREGGSFVHYAQYLRHLVAQGQAQLSNAARHVQGYEDTLQAPLQPLMDNLEAQTYETFEKDPMKYIKYEEGITKAIQHFHKKRTLERNSSDQVVLVLTVVGAGRGPLVAAALSASANTGIPLRIYAVEKNPNAVVILRSRVHSEVWSNVTVVDTDMRDWQPPELCDVMVSELLGSFGDNELSPECLDGAQKCLRSDGVSIPQSYTSYIAPIATSKLWNMAKAFNLSNSTIADGLNVAYVVRFHSSYQFAEAKPLFTFTHPNIPKEGTKIDNTR